MGGNDGKDDDDVDEMAGGDILRRNDVFHEFEELVYNFQD